MVTDAEVPVAATDYRATFLWDLRGGVALEHKQGKGGSHLEPALTGKSAGVLKDNVLHSLNGLSSGTPVLLMSVTLRVTSVRPCT